MSAPAQTASEVAELCERLRSHAANAPVISRQSIDMDAAASLIRAQSERERVLVDALEALKSDAAHVVDFYHRNGPTWTGKDGHEYDDMSSVIGRAEETISAIEAALTKAQP